MLRELAWPASLPYKTHCRALQTLLYLLFELIPFRTLSHTKYSHLHASIQFSSVEVPDSTEHRAGQGPYFGSEIRGLALWANPAAQCQHLLSGSQHSPGGVPGSSAARRIAKPDLCSQAYEGRFVRNIASSWHGALAARGTSEFVDAASLEMFAMCCGEPTLHKAVQTPKGVVRLEARPKRTSLMKPLWPRAHRPLKRTVASNDKHPKLLCPSALNDARTSAARGGVVRT